MDKHINIWLNQRGIENNLKSVRAAIAKTTNELAKLPYQTEEWYRKANELSKLKSIYTEMRDEIRLSGEEIEKAAERTSKMVINAGAIASVYTGASSAVRRFISTTQEYVDAYATIDDAMSAVQKTTGMTRDEVESLRNSLQNIDTRTSTEELLKIAEIGGRLGLAKEDIESFARSVDVANVALGDSFQGGAEEIATVLGKIRGAFQDTKEMGIEDAFNAIGSALNSVGATCAATEGNVAQFAQRLGALPDAMKPSVQEAIGLGAAFENSSINAEVAATAYGQLMTKAAANIGKFAAAMGEPVEEMRELLNTNPVEFMLRFAESMRGMPADELGAQLKDLKLNAVGVQEAIGAMSSQTDEFRRILEVSATEFANGTSMMEEFGTVNNNAAAQLEKAKNAVQDAKAALGKELMPVITDLTKSSASGLKILTSVAKFWAQHRVLLYSLVGAYGALKLAQKAVIAAQKEEEALTLANTVAGKAYTLVTKLLAVAKAKLAADTEAAAAAQAELKAAFATTPWGAIIVAVAALATGIGMLISKHREAKKAAEEFNTECAREQAEAEYLFDKLKKAEKGTKDYEDALQELKEKYPEIIQKHLDEEGALRDVEQAYKDVIVQIKAKIAEQMKEQRTNTLVSSTIEKQSEQYDLLRKKLRKKGKSESEVNDIVKDVQMMVEAGKSYEDVANRLNREGFFVQPKNAVYFVRSATDIVHILTDSQKEMSDGIDKINEQFDGFIEDGKKASDEIYRIDAQIAELEKQRYGENRKEIQKQIDNLKKLKQQKLDTAKAGSGVDPDKPNPPGSGTGGTNKSKKDPIADFEKKLKEFRTRQQREALDGWEKTKQWVIDSYQKMIDEAKELNLTDRVKELEEERTAAIAAAGQKWLKTASDTLQKATENADKLLRESMPDNGESPLMKAIAGEQSKWDEIYRTINENIDTYITLLKDPKLSQEEINLFQDALLKNEEALADATQKNAEAISNVIQQHAKADTDFIENKEKELARARMTEHDRRVAEIEEEYQLKIKTKEKEIEKLEELLKNNPGNSDIAKRIEELRKVIEQLEALQNKEIAAVPKGSGQKSVWQQLAEFDWSKMSENWQSALGLMSQGLQEFANAAFDIYGSIAQIQDNMMEAELQKTQETYDAKSAALQRQLNQGVISQKAYDAKMQKLNEEKEKKERKLKHEQFAREKTANIIQATIAGVLAAVESFKNGGGFPWGLIPMAMSAATTAAQIAVIASQANPYAKGSYIRGPQLALMGEEGDEWVASNKLLRDKKTAAVIAALDEYQRGNRKALAGITFAAPDPKIMSQAVSGNGRTFAPSNQVTNNYYPSDNGELLKELRQMNEFLKDPNNRRAYISRKIQLEFDEQEREVREMARL